MGACMSVTVSYDSSELKYTVSSDSDLTGRIRLFVWSDVPGLTVSNAVLYENWDTDFRPARIDNHKFNREVVIPYAGEQVSCVFSAPISPDSESYLADGTYVNPVNILVESLERSCGIKTVTYENGLVTVVTNTAHGYNTGDAVSIESVPGHPSDDPSYLGPNGLRIRGTFKVTCVDDTKFTYYTKGVQTKAVFNGADGLAALYKVVQYTDQPVMLNGNRVLYPTGSNPSYSVGDIVSTSTIVNSSVLDINDGVVVLNVDAPVTRAGEEGEVMYSPRTPSAAVPANYDPESDNASLYDHTGNTKAVRPSVDTYFTESGTYHQGESIMKCGAGTNNAVACMTFNVGGIEVSDGLSAVLRLFVKSMNYSELVVTVYQMSTAFWSPADSLDVIESNITAVPLYTATLKNPALKDYNAAEVVNDSGDYGIYVDLPLDTLIVDKWISNDPSYPASIAIKVTGDGSPYVSFSTNESADGNQPELIISGGEEGSVEEELFDIVTTASSVEPGERLCIMALGEGSFGNAPFNNVVKLGGTPVSLEYGTYDRLYVIVPDTVSGSVDVVVYRKMNSTGTDKQLTNPTIVYVKNDSYSRDIKLNERQAPGVIMRKTSRSAIYNRDLGFSNFTEITDETSLIQNVYSILLTRRGERLFDQNFGTRIEDTIFKLGSGYSEVDLLKECIEAVEKYEPRVKIDGDRSSCEFDDSGTYKLILCVVLPTARSEMIKFTFKNRGQVV